MGLWVVESRVEEFEMCETGKPVCKYLKSNGTCWCMSAFALILCLNGGKCSVLPETVVKLTDSD